MYTLIRSSRFDGWLSSLSDQKAKARILARLNSTSFGNFGDCEPVGAGYKIYYIRTELTVYMLLTGGDKSSQKKDITRAKQMARELKETRQ